jgi:hypothetical protein
VKIKRNFFLVGVIKMTEIKIKVCSLNEICELVSLKGKDIKGKVNTPIPEFMIVANSGKLLVTSMDAGKHIALQLNYNANIVEPGPIVIGNVEEFQMYLSRFSSSDEITVKTSPNRIFIIRDKPYKKATIPQSDKSIIIGQDAEQFLNRFKKTPDGYFESTSTKFNVKLVLNNSDLKDVIDDGEAVKQRVYPWIYNLKGLTIKVGEESEGMMEAEVLTTCSVQDGSEPNINTLFAFGVDNIFGNLSGEIQLYLANNIGISPVIVEKKTDEYEVRYILAPGAVVE